MFFFRSLDPSKFAINKTRSGTPASYPPSSTIPRKSPRRSHPPTPLLSQEQQNQIKTMGFCMSKFAGNRYDKESHGPVAEGLASSLRARRSMTRPGSRAQTPMRDATDDAVRDYEEQQAEMIDEVRGAFRTVEHIANFEWMLESDKPRLPQGAKETSKKRLRHYLLKHVINKNFRSPVQEILWRGGRVLDVGCGSGTWCIEMARFFPNATIFGIDTSSQFEAKDVPDNCYIQVSDARDLPFEEKTFDFIFMRNLIFDIKTSDYKEVVARMVHLLKPGGYIELVEQDVRLRNAGPITSKFIDIATVAFEGAGYDSRLTRRMHKFLMRDREITEVKTAFYSIPVGKSWGEPVAMLAATDLVRDYRSKRKAVAPAAGIGLADYDDIVESVNREFMTVENTYVNYRIVNGRKVGHRKQQQQLPPILPPIRVMTDY